MDIFDPLKRIKSGQKYVLVVVDYATKWPEAFPLKNIIRNCGIASWIWLLEWESLRKS